MEIWQFIETSNKISH